MTTTKTITETLTRTLWETHPNYCRAWKQKYNISISADQLVQDNTIDLAEHERQLLLKDKLILATAKKHHDLGFEKGRIDTLERVKKELLRNLAEIQDLLCTVNKQKEQFALDLANVLEKVNKGSLDYIQGHQKGLETGTKIGEIKTIMELQKAFGKNVMEEKNEP